MYAGDGVSLNASFGACVRLTLPGHVSSEELCGLLELEGLI